MFMCKSSNSENMDLQSCNDAVFESMNKLNDLVKKSDRQHTFYEVEVSSGGSVCGFVNYYKSKQILSFGYDPNSGWVRHNVVSEHELDSLVKVIPKKGGLHILTPILDKFPMKDSTLSVPSKIINF
ncbi:hypothetical protein D3C87_1738690 [compost metagenome]